MKMLSGELNHVSADVDYSQIPPIQQKRIIAFVNHFVTSTVSYLNNFCQSCESRFVDFEYKIQKIEASLLILEAQLSSIPEFDKPNNVVESQNLVAPDGATNVSQNQVETQSQPPTESANVAAATEQEVSVESSVPTGVKASEHPRFNHYFKMLRIGVRVQDVKEKMHNERVDPTILDNPDKIIPDSEEHV